MSATGSDAERRAGAVFDALADPTRRTVLRRVAEDGPLTATALTEHVPVTRQAIAKHLAVLQTAGLVSSTRHGRETLYSATVAPLAAAARWLEATGSAWDNRLERLVARADSRSSPGERR